MTGLSDARIAWIQERVLLGLGLDASEFEYMLHENLSKSSNGSDDIAMAPRAADVLLDFLGVKAQVGSSLFFHTEMENVEESEDYDEEYQESEPVAEGNPVSEGVPLLEGEDAPAAPAAAVQNGGTHDGGSTIVAKPLSEDGVVVATESPRAPDAPSDEAEGEGCNSAPNQQAAVAEVRLVTKIRKGVRTVLTTRRRCRLTQGNLPDYAERVVYFVKIMSDEVDRPASTSDHGSMIRAMEYGCLAGDCLTNLSAAIKEVFSPLLDHQLGLGVLAASVVGVGVGVGEKGSPDAAVAMPQDAPKVGDNLRNEFRANLHKFESQVCHATQQVKGDVHLAVPNINIDDPDIGNDFEAVSLLEGAMEEWSRLIASVVEAENLKRVKGKGPMAEIEFWRRRNASLSALYEQINMPKVNDHDLSRCRL